MSKRIPLLPPEGGDASDPGTSAPRSAATPSWVQMSTTPLHTALSGIGQEHIGPAATVWPTGQDSDAAQRAGRYLPETLRHPQRTLPAVAAQAINRYTQPGQMVFDPFVGGGTTMVEAIYAGRQAVGADIDLRWVDLSVRNVQYAHQHGATAAALLGHHDARHLGVIPRRMRGTVDLVVATPPVRLNPCTNPARPGSNADLVGQLEVDLKLALYAWTPLLHPGTVVVLTTRLLYRAHQMLDLTVPIAYAADWAGLEFAERIAALRIPLHDARRHPQRRTAARRRDRRARAVHDDVLVYRVPDPLPTWWRNRR